MRLDKTLNFKKVRCVKGYDDCLEIGKEYEVIDISVEIKVKDDEGEILYWESDYFEPVPDSAEKPLQNIELTPEFEAVEPKFEVGNKVYKYGETDVKTVLEVFEDGYMRISNYPHRVNHELLCHATPENHAMLSKPYPHIEFEQPPTQADTNADIKDTLKFKVGDKVYFGTFGEVKTVSEVGGDNDLELNGEIGWVSGDCCCHATQENYERLQATFYGIKFERPPLTGSDLARAMVDKGWFIVDCYVSAISDEDALRFRNKRMQVALFGDGLFTDGVKQFPFAVPFDPRTGEPLTESVLND